jgi:hypothetical protein
MRSKDKNIEKLLDARVGKERKVEASQDHEEEGVADDNDNGGEIVKASPTPVQHKKVKKSVRRARADPFDSGRRTKYD